MKTNGPVPALKVAQSSATRTCETLGAGDSKSVQSREINKDSAVEEKNDGKDRWDLVVSVLYELVRLQKMSTERLKRMGT